jgi:hypothetical protein
MSDEKVEAFMISKSDPEDPDLPEHLRMVYRSKGKLFFSAELATSEKEVLLACSFDAAPVVYSEEGHLYCESSWMAKNYPRTAAAIENVSKNLLGGQGED